MGSKEQGQQRAEKISKLRELKKYGKKVQIEVQQKRAKEKKEMMDEMKKIRKDQGGNKGSVAKRNAKDKKFGFGGKKRNVKRNDKKSTDDVSGFKPFNKGGKGGKSGFKGGKMLGKGANKRPGKANRQKIKNRKK